MVVNVLTVKTASRSKKVLNSLSLVRDGYFLCPKTFLQFLKLIKLTLILLLLFESYSYPLSYGVRLATS